MCKKKVYLRVWFVSGFLTISKLDSMCMRKWPAFQLPRVNYSWKIAFDLASWNSSFSEHWDLFLAFLYHSYEIASLIMSCTMSRFVISFGLTILITNGGHNENGICGVARRKKVVHGRSVQKCQSCFFFKYLRRLIQMFSFYYLNT